MSPKNNCKKIFMTCMVSAFLLCVGCKKQNEWLDIKSNKSNIIPSTLRDYQALLDYNIYMNDGYPGLPLVSSDNFYANYNTWQSISGYERYVYKWAEVMYIGVNSVNDWGSPYTKVEYANIVLDGLSSTAVNSQNNEEWHKIRGAALFYRAFSFYNLCGTFAKPYTKTSAATDKGIPIRVSSDINVKSVRASVQESYERILSDLKEAELLLPSAALYQTRPAKGAANALLAKVYLSMEQYDSALLYADRALQYHNTLLDFNSLTTTASKPMPKFPTHPEIIFYATSNLFSLGILNSIVDSILYRSYSANDLRKAAFFNNATAGPGFKGQYTGSNTPFGGIATNEILLVRAECHARQGNADKAMQDLNALLSRRWAKDKFTLLTANSPDEALRIILTERRKELPFTGILRWEDLRRLNKDNRFAQTITRVLGTEKYVLLPGGNRFVLPIPDNEIRLSGIEQNPR